MLCLFYFSLLKLGSYREPSETARTVVCPLIPEKPRKQLYEKYVGSWCEHKKVFTVARGGFALGSVFHM